jgi:DNA recombination protein RmuC
MPNWITLILLVINVILLLILLFKKQNKQENEQLSKLENLEREFQRMDASMKDEFRRNREEAATSSKQTREEISDSVLKRMTEIANLQKDQLTTFSNQLNQLTRSNEDKLDKMRETIETKIRHLQDENSKKLDEMRSTVDEKLQTTLEKRLGESFKQVSDRLELVHQGLGEMQTLASGVGDLKKVLSNVKSKGVLGEYQLENILDQLLTPSQYARNVKTKVGSNANVEFAIKLPGREDKNTEVWLPIDAKFPTEDFQNLMEAYEIGNIEKIAEHKKLMAARIKLFAKDINEKYIDPPNTTDFALMFLPFEGLYAEVLRIAGLFEDIQRVYKVVITGPTTISAFLNSLQMGFRTLAIEKRSSEVWELLGAIKTEFSNFGSILEKTHKKLQEASNVIDQASTRSRAIERRLKNVQELPKADSLKLIDDANNKDLLFEDIEDVTEETEEN